MAEQDDSSPPLPLIGAGIGVGEGAVMGFVAYVLFEDPAFAASIGLVSAVGGLLFLPYMLSLGAIRDGTVQPDALPGSGSIHVGALGGALSSAAIVGLAARFVIESATEPLAIALVYAALSFLALRFALPNVDSLADADGQTL